MLGAKYKLSAKHCQGVLDFLVRGGVRFNQQMGKKEKDPHAVHLGRLGGYARRRKLTSEQRREIARKAAEARWAKKKPAE
jgi:hypothetical protein